jgi:hypothetical protein
MNLRETGCKSGMFVELAGGCVVLDFSVGNIEHLSSTTGGSL